MEFTKKRPIGVFEELSHSKKAKFEQKLPNELWLKIINYLPTKDVFGNLALVNKHFRNMTFDPSSIKYLQIKIRKNEDLKDFAQVFQKYKYLVELNIDDLRPQNTKVFVTKPSVEIPFWSQMFDPTELRRLKSLKVSAKKPKRFSKYRKTQIFDLIKSLSNIEHLDLRNIEIEEIDFLEIILMNKLKTLCVTLHDNSLLTPKTLKALTDCCDQLETLEITDKTYFYTNQLVDAWNNFLKEPSKVLKRLKISMQCEYYKLENLSLCQNLDEFCLEGRVSYDDMKRVFQMKSLKKLELKDVPISNLIMGLDKSNLPNLENLLIETYIDQGWLCSLNLFDHLISKKYFPVLERLYVSTRNFNVFRIVNTKCIASNFPKLKSIQIVDEQALKNRTVDSKILDEFQFLYQLFKDFSIFVIFGKVNIFYEKQKKFEEYFFDEDPSTFRKYLSMKQNYGNCFESRFVRQGSNDEYIEFKEALNFPLSEPALD